MISTEMVEALFDSRVWRNEENAESKEFCFEAGDLYYVKLRQNVWDYALQVRDSSGLYRETDDITYYLFNKDMSEWIIPSIKMWTEALVQVIVQYKQNNPEEFVNGKWIYSKEIRQKELEEM